MKEILAGENNNNHNHLVNPLVFSYYKLACNFAIFYK